MHAQACTPLFQYVLPQAETAEPFHCTVVFSLPGGRPAIPWLLHALSQHFEQPGTAYVVKFEVGDRLPKL